MLQTLVLQLQALEPCADPDMHQNTVDSDVEQSRRVLPCTHSFIKQKAHVMQGNVN